MKILVAPNALKGSLSAQQAADAIARGIRRALADADIEKLPVADGGDGLLEVLAGPLHAEWIRRTVQGPLGQPVQASVLFCPSGRRAVIEMAAAAGLALLSPEQLDPLLASSHGVGELIGAALDLECRPIVLGIGGSATCDGGTGLACALGARFLNERGESLPGNGASLQRIRHIDLSSIDKRLEGIQFDVACDVDNPLLGPNGAARIYGPQKGASPAEVEQLEAGVSNFARCIETGLARDVRDLAGAGAAGGLGAGLLALFDAKLTPGAQLILNLLDIEQALQNTDLVITCEGRLDEQTRFGKAPAAVARAARSRGIPCIALAGSLDKTAFQLHDVGFQAVFSLCPGPVSLEEALENAADYLANTAEQVVRCFQPA